MFPIDADMPAFHAVVGVGKAPADLLGKPGGDGDGGEPTRAQHAGKLGHGADIVRDVFEDLRGDDPVEGRVGERQRQRVPAHAGGPGLRSYRLVGGHRGEQLPHAGDLRRRVVERDHVRPAPERFKTVSARAAAEIEQAASPADREPVEVDRQHGRGLAADV